MELKLNLEYEQILKIVHQLPENDIKRLVKSLQSKIASKKKDADFQELLLNAPIWSEDDVLNFQNARDQLNKSRIA